MNANDKQIAQDWTIAKAEAIGALEARDVLYSSIITALSSIIVPGSSGSRVSVDDPVSRRRLLMSMSYGVIDGYAREMALKAIAVKRGKRFWGHDTVKIFNNLPDLDRNLMMAMFAENNTDLDPLIEIMKRDKKPFEKKRYRFWNKASETKIYHDGEGARVTNFLVSYVTNLDSFDEQLSESD